MTFNEAIDLYIADMRAQGRINSDRTEYGYRECLGYHSDDVANRDPRYTNRADVKKTLRRWAHPNTQSVRRACLVSFYDWTMQELEPGRKDNPARQTVSPRRRKAVVYRMTRSEVAAFLAAPITSRERRAAFLGVCAGLRNKELRSLQRRHFERPGWVWVSADIGKGGRERWIPVLPDLEPVVAEILATVGPSEFDPDTGEWEGEYVIAAGAWGDPGVNRRLQERRDRRSSSESLRLLVIALGRRAGISARIGPHTMRHAFGDHVARFAGMRQAQFLLGHASIGTTETYVGQPTLDELAVAVRGMSLMRTDVPGSVQDADSRLRDVVGSVQWHSQLRAVEPGPERWLVDQLARLRLQVEAYMNHFGGVR